MNKKIFRPMIITASVLILGIALLFLLNIIPNLSPSKSKYNVAISWEDEDNCRSELCEKGNLDEFKKKVNQMLNSNCNTMQQALDVIESVNNYKIYRNTEKMKKWLYQAKMPAGGKKA